MSVTTLTPEEVAAKIADRFLDGAVKADHYLPKKDSGSYVFRGYLPNKRSASATASLNNHGLLHFGLRVPGNGGLGVHLHVLADEATPERIDRFLDVMDSYHQEALAAPRDY